MIDYRITAQDLPDTVDELEREKVARKGGYLLGCEESALLKSLANGLSVADAKASAFFYNLVSIGLMTLEGVITPFGTRILSQEPYVHPTSDVKENLQAQHEASLARIAAGVDVLVARVVVDGEVLTVRADQVVQALVTLHGPPAPGMKVDAKVEYLSISKEEFEAL